MKAAVQNPSTTTAHLTFVTLTRRFITYQIIVSMAVGFEFRGSHGYPSPFKGVMDSVSGIFTIDIIGVLHIDCFGRTDFQDRLLGWTLMPIGLGLLDAACQLGRMAMFGGAFLDGKAFRCKLGERICVVKISKSKSK